VQCINCRLLFVSTTIAEKSLAILKRGYMTISFIARVVKLRRLTF